MDKIWKVEWRGRIVLFGGILQIKLSFLEKNNFKKIKHKKKSSTAEDMTNLSSMKTVLSEKNT